MSIREKNGVFERNTEILKNKLKFRKNSVDKWVSVWYYIQADYLGNAYFMRCSKYFGG